MTQDAIFNLTLNSVKRFTHSFRIGLPDNIEIISSIEVINTFNQDIEADDKPKPFLTIELQGNESTLKYVYNTNLEDFANSVCDTFREGIKSMNSIDIIERKLLEDF